MKSLTVGCFAALCALGIQFAGFGAVYYSGKGTDNRTIAGGSVKWYSDRACTDQATVTPAKDDGNVYVFIASAKMNPSTFSAKAYFGCDGSLEGEAAGSFSTYANKGTFTFEDCTLVSGTFAAQGGPEAVAFAGNYYIPDNKKFTFQAFGSDRNFTFATNSVFTSGTNATITFLMTKVGGNCTTKFTVNGDFSGFKGRLVASTADRPQGQNVRGIVSLVSASSFGDPSSPLANAVTIGNSNYLHVAATAVQTSSRGITMDLSKGKRAGVYADANDRWTLTAPVTGTLGTFAKIGAGTTVLDGPFDFPTVDVEAGTLVLGKNGTFRNNMTVHVASGAKLALNQTPAGLAVTCDEGGSVVYEVPFDPETGTTPLQVTSEQFADLKTRFPDGIPLTLTKQVSLPLNERLRLPVMTIANGTAVTGDFLDLTGKTDNLPKTHFEIEETEGVQTVCLVVHAVIDYTNASDDKNMLTAANWSSGNLPEAGCDYRKPDNIGNGLSRTGTGSSIKEYIFGGDSLTVYGREIWNYAGDFYVPELVIKGNSGLLFSSGSQGTYRDKKIRGKIVPLNDGTSQTATFSYNMTTSIDFQAPIVGSGRVKIVSQLTSATVPTRISADNSGHTGRLVLGVDSTTYAMNLLVTNATALGGAMAAAAADGVKFLCTNDCSRVSMTAESDVTFNAANRGWAADFLTLGAVAGKTMTVDVPTFAVSGGLAMSGAGTLALKTALVGSGLATVPVAINEGYVAALDSAAWNAADFTVKDHAGFEVNLSTEDDALRNYGIKASSITPADGAIAVRGVLADADSSKSEIEATICTVPATNADLSNVWKPVKIPHHACTVKKVERTGDDEGLVSYVLHAELSGLMLMLK